jgi:hypothetical protein
LRRTLPTGGGEFLARDVDSDWQEASQGRFDLIIFRHAGAPARPDRGEKGEQALAPQGVVYIGTGHDAPGRFAGDFLVPLRAHLLLLGSDHSPGLQPRPVLSPWSCSQNSELWGIFRKSPESGKQPSKASTGRRCAAYKRERLARRVLLALSPRRFSALVPKPVKDLLPQNLKNKFRHLVYRH